MCVCCVGGGGRGGGTVSTGEAEAGLFWGGILRRRGLARDWVLTELLPHGPTPTDHVPRHRAVAATIAASRLSPWPLCRGE